MVNETFVDTGAWLALSDRSDQSHASAQVTFAVLLRSGSRLVTTNLVIAETYTLIRRRVGQNAALRFLQSTRASPRLERVYSTMSLEMNAEAILNRYADQDFSFVDAVSFALMQERGIAQAFAFDHHFLTCGFLLVS
jgi:predicted nucleic acid-binding protein